MGPRGINRAQYKRKYVVLIERNFFRRQKAITDVIALKADLEGSLAVPHSEDAASLTPSCYILLVESSQIEMSESRFSGRIVNAVSFHQFC